MRPIAVAGLTFVLVVSVLGLCSTPVGGSPVAGETVPTANDTPAPSDARILELYPNPNTTGDTDEFVTVWLPPNSEPGSFELADEHVTVALNETASTTRPSAVDGSRITFSTDPPFTEALTGRNVGEIDDRLQLADRGDTIRLLHDGTVVDEVSYERAPVGERYDARNDTWIPLGATEKELTRTGAGTVEAFTLPDEPQLAREFLAGADDRILLAGYTISSPAVVETLEAQLTRGVDVEILAEGSPVGGLLDHEAEALDALDSAGATVHVIGGDLARYRYHHAKYAVADDEALVTTENWNRAGLDGKSSRGWGVVTGAEAIVDDLVGVFREDSGWVDAIAWEAFDPTVVDGERASGSHPQHFEAATVTAEEQELLLAPDNAKNRLLNLVYEADESIDVKQVRIGDENFPLLEAVVDAADRGVDVRILLSSEWYVVEENRELTAWLEEQAAAGDWSLEVRLARPFEEFEKIHAKGLLVDGQHVYVGSINWNNNSISNNREVGLLLSGAEVAGYFGDVFEADWRGEYEEATGDTAAGWQLPVGLAVAVGVIALLAIAAVRCLDFGGQSRQEDHLRRY